MPSPQKKYTTLVSNTLLFAISNFSSKLLSFFIRPYLSYALDSPDVMGVSSLLQQATNLLIPVVSLGVAYAVIRFGLDKATNKSSVFVNGAATIGLGFVVLLLAMPLVRLIPNAAEYLGFLYLCVLASCMRTLCTQFIRSRMLNRLVAIDGVLTTLSLLLYYSVPQRLKNGRCRLFAGKRAGRFDIHGVCVHCGRVLAVLQAQGV